MTSRAEQGGGHPGRPEHDGQPGAGGVARDDAAELLELLHTASRRMRREAVADCAEPPGTTPGQVRLLRFLAHASGPVRAADVAAAMELAPRSVTSKVDQAEADGYVRRVPDPSDRRARLLELTDAGHEVLEDLWSRRRAGAAGRLERLTPVERALLLQLLRAVAEDQPVDHPART
ncbi:MarR family winged helix-turn-helix transcriptional regulator [Antribacter sp. KLBMP9083]|uniref:MarR family winged helix-turn-helix transcriptional regulator n=1 Tax=Antribacter soli TaxID=2910976 RepID=A0AA41UBL0_9MICO|nr:MarR family winged helix-turn-helix transcriptional regulator [Antribacter soli]MCF4121214.1 MarR family winged helix-turn-helix transcriptional regulator [Antribacter soli]